MGDATTYEKILTRGPISRLPEIDDGKIRLATDAEELFFDVGSSRIKITDVVKGYTATAILDTTSPLDKIYLASDTNQMYYYDTTNTAWINISKNHTHTSADITGLGDLAAEDTVTINVIDSVVGLDFGSEDDTE